MIEHTEYLLLNGPSVWFIEYHFFPIDRIQLHNWIEFAEK